MDVITAQESTNDIWNAIEWLIGTEIAAVACAGVWMALVYKFRKPKWDRIDRKLDAFDGSLNKHREESRVALEKLQGDIREQMESLKTQITGVQFQQARDYATKDDLRRQGADLKELIGLKDRIESLRGGD